MIQRCDKPYSHAYKDYGGRGIRVCERWYDFNNYLEDVGNPPSSKHTIDRIDNDGDYEPSNVRWALRDIQTHNQRPRTKSGYKGVYEFQGKYRASIIRGRIYKYLGTFDTAEEAYEKYIKVERELYVNT